MPKPKINFVPFPMIHTERLTLRQLQTEDEDQIFALQRDEQVGKYLNRPKAQEIDTARRFIQKVMTKMASNEWIMWAINYQGDNQLIGTICLWNICPEDSKAEIGYEMLPDYQGKGMMQEALKAVLSYGFEQLELDSIEAYFHQDNVKSRRLLERGGFIPAVSEKEGNTVDERYVLLNNRLRMD